MLHVGSPSRATAPALRSCLVLSLALLHLAACGSVQSRNPAPPEVADALVIPGISRARIWGDEAPPYLEEWESATEEDVNQGAAGVVGVPHNYLAISGGGENGAFGAGVLCGWTASGTRPEFTIVTGISTGALTAPFAFLGPDYDDELERVFTSYRTEDLVETRSSLAAITGDSLAGTAGLRDLIAQHITPELVEKVAVEARRGRYLSVATTNLDAQRPVVWDLGVIAASDHPDKVQLFRDVLLASASIPIAFPPVLFEVEAPDGKRYDELHVDGGATSQVYLYPIGLNWDRIKQLLRVVGTPNVYVIRNGRLSPRYEPVNPPGLMGIAGATIPALIRTQGLGDLYRMFLASKRDGLDYHLAFVPDDFDEPQSEQFDPVYMRKLFDRGFEMAKNGYPWAEQPPGLLAR